MVNEKPRIIRKRHGKEKPGGTRQGRESVRKI